MRSLFGKIAIAALVILGLVQQTESVQLKNMVQSSARHEARPNILAEIIHNSQRAQNFDAVPTQNSTMPSKQEPPKSEGKPAPPSNNSAPPSKDGPAPPKNSTAPPKDAPAPAKGQ